MDALTDTTDKETNERTNERTDERMDNETHLCPSVRSSLRWSLTLMGCMFACTGDRDDISAGTRTQSAGSDGTKKRFPTN